MNTHQTKRKLGRPSTYSDQLADRICERIAHGEPLTKICKSPGMPAYTTVLGWRVTLPQFSDKYARAREDAADTLADRILELASRVESGKLDFNAGRVAIDAMKWAASKLKPKSYGDRTQVELGGNLSVEHVPISEAAPSWLKDKIAGRIGAVGAAAAVASSGHSDGSESVH